VVSFPPVTPARPYTHTHINTYILTYLLTPWCRVLLENLTGLKLAKKFPAFHGNRRFITALTSVRHLYLSWANKCLQRKQPACDCFLTGLFYKEGLLAPRPTPKLEDHPSSAVHDCLFNLYAATLHIGGRSSIRNLRTRHDVVTGAHYILSSDDIFTFRQVLTPALG